MVFSRDSGEDGGHGVGVTSVEESVLKVPSLRQKVPSFRQDLTVLLKVRLNFFVLVTTFFGYLLAR